MNTQHVPPEMMAQNASAAAELLRILANEHRLMVLCHLLDREMNVSELLDVIPLSQSALSQHLSKLREHGIVETRREGLMVHYRIADPAAGQVIQTLAGIFCPETCL